MAIDASGSLISNGSVISNQGFTATGNMISTNAIETTMMGSGALIVRSGGASIAGNTYIGGNVFLTSSQTNLLVSGNTRVYGTQFGNIEIEPYKTLTIDASGS